MNWIDYQEKTADLFKNAGMNAVVNKKVNGARTNFNIDVYIEFISNGFKQIWLIECKYLNSKVDKGTVSLFQNIMYETGANKGFIVTEIGYQSGAKELATKSAIELVTFNELQEALKSTTQQIELNRVKAKIRTLTREIHLGFFPENEPFYTKKRKGVDEDGYYSVWPRLINVSNALEPPILGRNEFPRIIMLDPNTDLDGPTNWAKNLDELLNKANIILIEIEGWWVIQKKAIEALNSKHTDFPRNIF